MAQQSGPMDRELESVTLGELVAAAFDAAEETTDHPEHAAQIARNIVVRAILFHSRPRRRAVRFTR